MTSPTPLRNHTLPNHRANRQHVSETMLDAIPESANRGGYVRGRGPRAFTKAFTKMVTSMKPETNPEAALATADEHQTYVYLIDISCKFLLIYSLPTSPTSFKKFHMSSPPIFHFFNLQTLWENWRHLRSTDALG